jgi:stringent starvation protein B
MTMTSNRPYLIRAFYDWIVDNNLTPYILVNAEYPGVQVPAAHVQHARIVLNISPTATRGLLLENDRLIFSARFSGQTEQIFLPPGAVLEIYAKENGRGIAFSAEESEGGGGAAIVQAIDSKNTSVKKPALTLVKKTDE